MSSENAGEKPARRKPKVSWGRFVRPGLGDPKSRPRGVDDGQPVNIPAPPGDALELDLSLIHISEPTRRS